MRLKTMIAQVLTTYTTGITRTFTDGTDTARYLACLEASNRVVEAGGNLQDVEIASKQVLGLSTAGMIGLLNHSQPTRLTDTALDQVLTAGSVAAPVETHNPIVPAAPYVKPQQTILVGNKRNTTAPIVNHPTQAVVTQQHTPTNPIAATAQHNSAIASPVDVIRGIHAMLDAYIARMDDQTMEIRQAGTTPTIAPTQPIKDLRITRTEPATLPVRESSVEIYNRIIAEESAPIAFTHAPNTAQAAMVESTQPTMPLTPRQQAIKEAGAAIVEWRDNMPMITLKGKLAYLFPTDAKAARSLATKRMLAKKTATQAAQAALIQPDTTPVQSVATATPQAASMLSTHRVPCMVCTDPTINASGMCDPCVSSVTTMRQQAASRNQQAAPQAAPVTRVSAVPTTGAKVAPAKTPIVAVACSVCHDATINKSGMCTACAKLDKATQPQTTGQKMAATEARLIAVAPVTVKSQVAASRNQATAQPQVLTAPTTVQPVPAARPARTNDVYYAQPVVLTAENTPPTITKPAGPLAARLKAAGLSDSEIAALTGATV